jgi:hypothetical protein
MDVLSAGIAAPWLGGSWLWWRLGRPRVEVEIETRGRDRHRVLLTNTGRRPAFDVNLQVTVRWQGQEIDDVLEPHRLPIRQLDKGAQHLVAITIPEDSDRHVRAKWDWTDRWRVRHNDLREITYHRGDPTQDPLPPA